MNGETRTLGCDDMRHAMAQGISFSTARGECSGINQQMYKEYEDIVLVVAWDSIAEKDVVVVEDNTLDDDWSGTDIASPGKRGTYSKPSLFLNGMSVAGDDEFEDEEEDSQTTQVCRRAACADVVTFTKTMSTKDLLSNEQLINATLISKLKNFVDTEFSGDYHAFHMHAIALALSSPRYRYNRQKMFEELKPILRPRLDFAQLLPPELVLYIFSYLDPLDLCTSIPLVSKTWHALADDESLWRSIILARRRDRRRSRTLSNKSLISTLTSLLSSAAASSSNGPAYTAANVWKRRFIEDYDVEKNWRRGRHRAVSVLEGHTDMVSCLQFDPYSQTLVSGSFDRTLKVWDLKKRENVRTMSGHIYMVSCLAFDGNRLVSGSRDKTLKVWDLSTFQCVGTLKAHTERVLCVQLAARYNLLVSGSEDRTIKVWDLAKGKTRFTLGGHTDCVECLWLGRAMQGATPRLLATGSSDKSVRVWDLETQSCLTTLLRAHADRVMCLQMGAASYAGWGEQLLVTGSEDRLIKGWDLRAGGRTCVMTLVGHESIVRSLQFDERKLVSGAWDKTARVWDLRRVAVMSQPSTGKSHHTVSGGKNTVSLVAANRPGPLLATLVGHSDGVSCLQFDEERLITGSGDTTLRLWGFK